jgi:hypothetical protein
MPCPFQVPVLVVQQESTAIMLMTPVLYCLGPACSTTPDDTQGAAMMVDHHLESSVKDTGGRFR